MLATAETLGEAFLAVAERPDVRLYFWRDDGTREGFTYGDLAADALRVAGHLRATGVQPGERVALVLPTHPDFYRAFFGIVLAGAVPVALYPPVRLGRIEEWKERTAAMLRSARAVLVLTERRLVGLLGAPVQRVGPRLGCRTVGALVKEGPSAQTVRRAGRDLACVQFSSGSTGDPKPVALSHHNMISNASAILGTLPGRISDHSGVSWLPLYHDMGLIGALLVAILGPGDLTLIGPERFVARPRVWLEALTATRATISVAPNFAFGLCVSRIPPEEVAGLDLSHWRMAICGAEPIHPDTMDAFAARFGAVGFRPGTLTPVYGLAEATLAVTFSAADEVPRRVRFDADRLELQQEAVRVEAGGRLLAALGRPLPGVRIEIRDDQRRPLPDGRVGTVWVAGGGVMQGYLDRPDATAEVLVDGWLITGDQGFVLEGELFLCGRAKDIVIVRGRNHDPALIEQSLDAVQGLRTGCAAAFGVDDPQTGTEALVVLAERRGESVAADDALARAAVEAIRHATGLDPQVVEVLEPGTLPRTSSGKIRRSEARRRWLSGELEPPGRAGVSVLLTESVKGLKDQLRALFARRLSG